MSVSSTQDKKKSKTWIWLTVFIVIALLSVWAVASQSSSFSLGDFFEYIQNANPFFIAAAFGCMILFIVFEGLALVSLCRLFGYRTRVLDGCFYSSSDIYFSAVTPSATGGQPACAYFMMKDGISGTKVTAALLLNLCMYLASTLIIGICSFVFKFEIFLSYTAVSQILILVGATIIILLIAFFVTLIVNFKLLHHICGSFIHLLAKIRLVRNEEKWQTKLRKYIDGYAHCPQIIAEHKHRLWLVLLFNLLQRISQIAIVVLIYISTSCHSPKDALDVFFMQGYTMLGSNCIPIPGGVGVSDFLMLDGFSCIMAEGDAVNLEILSRAFSFYICVIICGTATAIRYFKIKRRPEEQ